MPSWSSAWMSAELVEREVAPTLDLRELADVDEVRALADVLVVWLLVPSRAAVSSFKASTSLESDWSALVTPEAVAEVAEAVLVVVPLVAPDELVDEVASCSAVRNARASEVKRSDGAPGGGGGGPSELPAPWTFPDWSFWSA